MAKVIITISDAPGPAPDLEVIVGSNPSMPLKDDDLDTDDPTCTPAMAAAVAAVRFIASLGVSFDQFTAENMAQAEYIHRVARRAKDQ